MLEEIVKYIWVALVFISVFVCWAKGWMKKGFYITSDQARENDAYLAKKEEEKLQKKRILREKASKKLSDD